VVHEKSSHVLAVPSIVPQFAEVPPSGYRCQFVYAETMPLDQRNVPSTVESFSPIHPFAPTVVS
jgi:hypothetical protein